jgi:hypothetical protein
MAIEIAEKPQHIHARGFHFGKHTFNIRVKQNSFRADAVVDIQFITHNIPPLCFNRKILQQTGL